MNGAKQTERCARFGPAGNCRDFYATGKKSTEDMLRYVAAQGLTAYEYQCGRGVRLSEETAETLRKLAQPGDMILTVGAGDIYRVGDMLVGKE